MSQDTFNMTCECNSFCTRSVTIPLDDAMRIHASQMYLIVNDCARGPEKTDVLAGEYPGYKLYRDHSGDKDAIR